MENAIDIEIHCFGGEGGCVSLADFIRSGREDWREFFEDQGGHCEVWRENIRPIDEYPDSHDALCDLIARTIEIKSIWRKAPGGGKRNGNRRAACFGA